MNDSGARFQRRRRMAVHIFVWIVVPTILSAGFLLTFRRVLLQDPDDPQTAIDAAALEAAHQIAVAADDVRLGGGDPVRMTDAASNEARRRAAEVAASYGVKIDAATDIQFGAGQSDASSGTWLVNWGRTPYDVVRVTAIQQRRSPNADFDKPTISRTIRIYRAKN